MQVQVSFSAGSYFSMHMHYHFAFMLYVQKESHIYEEFSPILNKSKSCFEKDFKSIYDIPMFSLRGKS